MDYTYRKKTYETYLTYGSIKYKSVIRYDKQRLTVPLHMSNKLVHAHASIRKPGVHWLGFFINRLLIASNIDAQTFTDTCKNKSYGLVHRIDSFTWTSFGHTLDKNIVRLLQIGLKLHKTHFDELWANVLCD